MIKRFILMMVLAGCGSAPPTIIYQEVPVEVPAESTGLMVVDTDGQEVGPLVGVNTAQPDWLLVLKQPYLFWVSASDGSVQSEELDFNYYTDSSCSEPPTLVGCRTSQFKKIWTDGTELYELAVQDPAQVWAGIGCVNATGTCVAEPVPLQLQMNWVPPLEVVQ